MQELDQEIEKLKLEKEIYELVSMLFNNKASDEIIDTNTVIENSIKLLDRYNRKHNSSKECMQEYLEYICKHKADKKNTTMMVMLAKKYGHKFHHSVKHENKKCKGKEMNYKIHDDLEGFCVKNGCYRWSEEKINAFFKSLKNIK